MNWMGVWSGLIYASKIFIADLLFLSSYKKRRRYLLRLLLPLIGAFLITVAVSFIPYSVPGWVTFLRFLSVNAVIFICMLFCYDSSFFNILFCCTAAMALEQFSSSLMRLIKIYLSFEQIINIPFVASALNEAIIFMPMSITFYFFFARRIKTTSYDDAANLKMKIMSAVIVFVCIGIYRFADGTTTNGIITRSLYSMTCCLFALVIQFSFYEQITLRKKLNVANELYRQEIKHYEKWRNSIDLINIKYHDLKHQISVVKPNEINKDWQEIEKALAVYENMLKTGNDILDNILSEKRTLGGNFNISMTCMADGEALSGMSDVDIFALFGNALDNAMNAVKQVEDESKRNISIIVRRVGEAVAIHIENYYKGELTFADGLPQTTGDNNIHGFGMKSINMIVEKYNGTMSLTASDNIFILDIMLFPKST